MVEEMKTEETKRNNIFLPVVVCLLIINTVLNVVVVFLIYNSMQKIQNLQQISRQLQQNVNNQPPANVPQTNDIELMNQRNDCDKDVKGYEAVFIYSPTCPHCQKMKPLVSNSSLKWYWVNVYNQTCMSLNLSVFKFEGWVPTFYCLKTGNVHVGEMTQEDFQKWVASCR